MSSISEEVAWCLAARVSSRLPCRVGFMICRCCGGSWRLCWHGRGAVASLSFISGTKSEVCWSGLWQVCHAIALWHCGLPVWLELFSLSGCSSLPPASMAMSAAWFPKLCLLTQCRVPHAQWSVLHSSAACWLLVALRTVRAACCSAC